MKKLSLFMSCLILIVSGCFDESIIETDSTLPPQGAVTRTAGDGIYDVLGYGYDTTEEYMGENSTKLKIIDVDAFVRDHKGRFDNPFVGVIDQRVFAGEDAYSFLNQVISETNFGGSIGSIGKKDSVKGFFSGTIKTGFKSNTLSSYSSKYSFARAEVLKKQRKYLLNTDISTLSKYLSSTFMEDLNKYPADKIIEMYGTHVLTNITVGGKYVADYKSVVLESTNRTEKTKTVSAGAKFNLSKIGLDANGSWSKTEITELNKKNTNWECHIKSIGGSTSGTSITITPNQSTSYTINLGAWTESVDDKHAKLIDVDWNATYPLYELISDPVKKSKIKDAVIKYINSKQIKVIEVYPLYQYGKAGNYHYNTQTYSLGWNREGITCYVLLSKGNENVYPLYQYGKGGSYHYNTQTYSLGWNNEGPACFIYKEKLYEDLVPLYQFQKKGKYHYNTQVYSSGWVNDGPVGYVFPQ